MGHGEKLRLRGRWAAVRLAGEAQFAEVVQGHGHGADGGGGRSVHLLGVEGQEVVGVSETEREEEEQQQGAAD